MILLRISNSLSFQLKILLLLCHFILVIQSNILQGYNERCELYDETSSCDETVGLMCIDTGIKGYRCRCPNDAQFGTIYDSKRNKCVGKALNSCVRLNNQIPPTSKVNLNDTLCVENSECNGSMYRFPICVCTQGFFESDEGTCVLAAKHGENCDQDGKTQCDEKYGLSCNSNGKCGCKDESHQFYDHIHEKCLTFVDGNCTEDTQCVPMAHCSRPSFGLGVAGLRLHTSKRRRRSIIFGQEIHKNPTFSSPNMSPNNRFNDENGKCVCNSGFSPTNNNFCMPTYGTQCFPRKLSEHSDIRYLNGNTSEICNPEEFLECLSAKDSTFRCTCRNALNEKWDLETRKCVSRPGKRCRASSAYPSCETGSECIRGVCQCSSGSSVLTPNGQCKLGFNEACKPGECDASAGLTCHGKTETCLCVDSYLRYDKKRKACLAEINSPCGPIQIQGDEAETFIHCEEKASCLPIDDKITKNVGYICKNAVKS